MLECCAVVEGPDAGLQVALEDRLLDLLGQVELVVNLLLRLARGLHLLHLRIQLPRAREERVHVLLLHSEPLLHCAQEGLGA